MRRRPVRRLVVSRRLGWARGMFAGTDGGGPAPCAKRAQRLVPGLCLMARPCLYAELRRHERLSDGWGCLTIEGRGCAPMACLRPGGGRMMRSILWSLIQERVPKTWSSSQPVLRSGKPPASAGDVSNRGDASGSLVSPVAGSRSRAAQVAQLTCCGSSMERPMSEEQGKVAAAAALLETPVRAGRTSRRHVDGPDRI